MRGSTQTAKPTRWLYVILIMLVPLLNSACSIKNFRAETFDSSALAKYSQTRTSGDITVTAAVPGKQQAEDIFGIPVYDSKIQPVWLSIHNQSDKVIRFAPTSVDPEYFSPLEVSYKHRKGHNSEARLAMDKHFFNLAMPRVIKPNSTAEGFVFTNMSLGTKSFVVDTFSNTGDESFAFFLTVPGFSPDYSNVQLDKLYAAGQMRDFERDSFREFINNLYCCTNDHQGEPTGLPISIVMIAPGGDALRALLRAGWYETAWINNREDIDPEEMHYLFGRMPDAIFRKDRREVERNELHMWMSPWRVDGLPVWVAQIQHFVGRERRIEEVFLGASFDPDLDDGRNFFMQSMWYNQGLKQYAWSRYDAPISRSAQRQDFLGNNYFTDGARLIVWLSGTPVSMLETNQLLWDRPSPRSKP